MSDTPDLMDFLDVKTDFTFKQVFDSEQSKEIFTAGSQALLGRRHREAPLQTRSKASEIRAPKQDKLP
uniref:hypothetical protein n=2 Tax=Candidatus Electrothrix sp. TaxID=2170559 RepID=UPI004056B689